MIAWEKGWKVKEKGGRLVAFFISDENAEDWVAIQNGEYEIEEASIKEFWI